MKSEVVNHEDPIKSEDINHSEAPKNEENPFNKLFFTKLKIPRLIPEVLIESVKGKTFTAEMFYDYQESQVDNESNFLYVLIDENKKIHGYLWAEMNNLDNSLFVNTFSVSKDFWGKGKSAAQAINKAIYFLKTLKEKVEASRVFWITSNEKFFIKQGFKRSKNVLMEYED